MTIERSMIYRDQETADRYSEIARHYSQDWRGELTQDLKSQVAEFCEYLGAPPKKILDAGCGTGKISTYLAKLGYEPIGLDLSYGMLKETVSEASSKQLSVRPILANMRHQPLANASVDGVWNMAAIVHLDHAGKQAAIAEYNRILNPGGILHLSVQNLFHKKHLRRIAQSYLYWLGYDENNQYYQQKKSLKEIQQGLGLISRLMQGYAYLDNRHWFFPTKNELMALLSKSGFQVLDSNHAFSKRTSIFARKTN
jgi:ubiquinone/menaquinone biosynthesis C-methylase UbiE